MRFGSLFTGVGGGDVGLEEAGMECAWQVEIDPFCKKVLEARWPHVKRMADVRQAGVADLESVDLICGGFPCQDISYAGKGAGIEGFRSGLWKEYARIVGELRPRYVLVENVTALLERGLGRVLRDLASLGYDAEWDCIPACALGAPHRRDRIWVLAYPRGSGGERLVQGPYSRQLGPWRWRGEKDLRSVVNAPFERGDRWPEPLLRGVDARIPNRAHRLKAVGNSMCPQVVEWIGRRIMEHEKLGIPIKEVKG